MIKLKIVIICLLAILAQKANAQKIHMYKTGFFNVIYMLNDTTELSPKQTAFQLFSHEKAYDQFKTARRWSTVSALTGGIGAAAVAIPAVTWAFGERSDLGLAIGGGSLLAFGLISNWIYKGRAFGAIELYNEDLPQKSSRIKPEFQFYGTGARLVIRF